MTSTATLQAALEVMKNQRSVDRLFGRVSLRRDRPDPLHLLHDAPGAAEIPAEGAALPHGRGDGRHRLCRTHARRREQGPARRCPGDDGPQGRSERRSVGRYRSGVRRRTAGRRRPAGGHRQDSGAAREIGARPDRQGSFGARLHPRVRRQGQRGWRAARAIADAGRLPGPSSACPALRHGHRAAARSDAGVRRPRRRADAGQPQGGGPAALRRHRQGDGRVQLRVARARHGARRPARADADSDSGRRHRRRSVSAAVR